MKNVKPLQHKIAKKKSFFNHNDQLTHFYCKQILKYSRIFHTIFWIFRNKLLIFTVIFSKKVLKHKKQIIFWIFLTALWFLFQRFINGLKLIDKMFFCFSLNFPNIKWRLRVSVSSLFLSLCLSYFLSQFHSILSCENVSLKVVQSPKCFSL